MPRAVKHSGRQPVIEPLEDRRLLSADLSAAFSGRLPTALPPGGTSSIQIRLANRGSSIAQGAVQVQLFASTDTTLDARDFPLTAKSLNIRLRPRAGENVRFSFPTPTTLPHGNYYLLAEIEGSSATIGSPAVAVSRTPVSIQTPFSDLALQFAMLPSQPIELDGPSAGSRIATVLVSNSGNISVRGKVTLNLYLSSDNVLDSSDPLLATSSNRAIALKPGGHSPTGFRIAVPAGTNVGGYFLIATMTPVGSLSDSNAANNVAVSSRRVAVVTQLPHTSVRNHGGYDIGSVNNTTVVATSDCPPDSGDSGDSTDDSSDSSDNTSQDDSQPPAPAPDDSVPDASNSPTPTDSSSSTSISSPTGDSSYPDDGDDGSDSTAYGF